MYFFVLIDDKRVKIKGVLTTRKTAYGQKWKNTG